MAGHSKWNNIKRKKEKTDAQKAKVFTKIGREISVAVREGGPDPAVNGKLKDLIAKAKSNNVPNDNIDRIIKKAAGDGDKNNYESITYEGYGPNGVAVLVDCLTDNRNRTASDIRHYFDKYGGKLGTSGCVSFMFESKGLLGIENKGFSEERIMDDCLESGASDFEYGEEAIEIVTSSSDFHAVKSALEKKGYEFAYADIEQVPSTFTKLTDEDSKGKMTKLLELLEDNDDVQNVWHNLENEDDL